MNLATIGRAPRHLRAAPATLADALTIVLLGAAVAGDAICLGAVLGAWG